MEVILIWQIVVAASVGISRIFSSGAMIGVASLWTLWTFFAVWTSGLMLLQLGTAWGTVWLLSSFFTEKDKVLSVYEEQKHQSDKAHDHDSSSKDSDGKNIDGTGSENLRQEVDAPPKKLTIASILEGVTSVANSTSSAAIEVGKCADELSDYFVRQSAKMDANRDFGLEIFKLQRSVEHVVESAARYRQLLRNLGGNLKAVESYHANLTKIGALLGQKPERRFELKVFNLPPQQLSDLPPLAADERVIELKNTLELLNRVKTRVDDDKELLQEIEKLTNEDFKKFLFTQERVLSRHLQALKPVQNSSKNKDDLPTFVVSDGNHNPFDTIRKDAVYSTGVPVLLDTVYGIDNQSDSSFTAPSFNRERNNIQTFAQELDIPHLVHFTRCENLMGILKHGLASVTTCETKGIAAIRNDADRYDGKPDGISLSIAFPNYRMFYKYRQIFKDVDWAVLLFSPKVIWEKDCAFYRYNAADARVSREPRDKMKSLDAFRDMFTEDAGPRENILRRFDPSDPQAEILVFETIPSVYIEAVAFETHEVAFKYKDVIGELESFYAGPGRGLFGSRLRSRAN